MCACDATPPDLYNSKIVKVRKPHRCCECAVQIEKGQECEKVDGLWEGSFSTLYTCLQCKELWGYLGEKEMDCCMEHGILYEEIFALFPEDDDAQGRYCEFYALELPWLKPRVDGRFQLAKT
ncbi:MAG: hypothetical protein WBB28_01220 [Crinalium sp.]